MTTAVFQSRVAKATNMIMHNQTLVGESVKELLTRGELQILHFNQINRQDYQVLCDLVDIDANRFQLPAQGNTLQEMNRKALGFHPHETNRLYINENQSVINIAKTIVHEANHYLNANRAMQERKVLGDYLGATVDEFRARMSERLYDNKPLTQCVYRTAAQQAQKDFGNEAELSTPYALPYGQYVTPQFQQAFDAQYEHAMSGDPLVDEVAEQAGYNLRPRHCSVL